MTNGKSCVTVKLLRQNRQEDQPFVMKTVTQTMLYRQALIKYSLKYGVTKAAIRYKTNRQYVYRWRKRYDGTLQSLADKSHRPHHHPNLGSILENVMAQNIKSNGFKLRYFDATKYGEIDFVVQNGLQTRLVEIKSGNDYKKHKALDNVRSVSEWSFESSTVFCKGNIETENRITYLPWYMIMFFTPEQPPEEFKHEIDLSALQ